MPSMSLRGRVAGQLRRAAEGLDRPEPSPAPRGAPKVASDSPPGSRTATWFFDRFPRFYDTSETSPYRGRLNLRYEAIFRDNADIFDGASVVDIASHDGRWSLAALETGAKSVVGIEARKDLVDHAVANLSAYGHDGAFRFIHGDVFETFARETFDADVVLCLGFLY